ncbi:MAG: thymidylate kinase [Firmicutes bacterium]|nr:thymidylate kinase [Bacillota bacterium]
MMTGFFITFEGPDGAGKTTQLNLLAKYLGEKGLTVLGTREPGGTVLGESLRKVLLDPAYHGMCARAEALMYMAARAQHVAEIINPALKRGEVVICDRYADSTIVYQGVARKLESEELLSINQFAANGLKPDLTILLDGDIQLLDARRAERGSKDRIEQEAREFHEAVRQGFLKIAAAEPDRIKVVSQGGGIDTVHQAVVKIVEAFLTGRTGRT